MPTVKSYEHLTGTGDPYTASDGKTLDFGIKEQDNDIPCRPTWPLVGPVGSAIRLLLDGVGH